MGEYGFKDLSVANWLEPDPVVGAFAKFTSDGNVESITYEDLFRNIYKPSLNSSVPTKIAAMYEVARGAMCYAYFFYPIFALASEQLYRVAEAAVTFKCQELNAPKGIKSFAKKTDYLIEEGIIPEEQRIRWRGIRGLRNITSHPDRQSIIPPGNAIRSAVIIAFCINQLFNAAQQHAIGDPAD